MLHPNAAVMEWSLQLRGPNRTRCSQLTLYLFNLRLYEALRILL
jgi:hypothetical protein